MGIYGQCKLSKFEVRVKFIASIIRTRHLVELIRNSFIHSCPESSLLLCNALTVQIVLHKLKWYYTLNCQIFLPGMISRCDAEVLLVRRQFQLMFIIFIGYRSVAKRKKRKSNVEWLITMFHRLVSPLDSFMMVANNKRSCANG